MSALSPHIRVLRAEAAQLTGQGQCALEAAQVAIDKGDSLLATVESTVATMLVRLSNAKLVAANALEAEQRELEARVSTIPPRDA